MLGFHLLISGVKVKKILFCRPLGTEMCPRSKLSQIKMYPHVNNQIWINARERKKKTKQTNFKISFFLCSLTKATDAKWKNMPWPENVEIIRFEVPTEGKAHFSARINSISAGTRMATFEFSSNELT